MCVDSPIIIGEISTICSSAGVASIHLFPKHFFILTVELVNKNEGHIVVVQSVLWNQEFQ